MTSKRAPAPCPPRGSRGAPFQPSFNGGFLAILKNRMDRGEYQLRFPELRLGENGAPSFGGEKAAWTAVAT